MCWLDDLEVKVRVKNTYLKYYKGLNIWGDLKELCT